MKNNFKFHAVLRQNYREVIFVFLAFALMTMSAYIFIGRILQDRLLHGAEILLSSAEANVTAGLSEAETTLLNSYYIVQGMLEQDAPREEILEYLITTTEWMRVRDQGLFGFYGIYGYIHGEFYDSVGLNPGDDFIPQRRPWYQAAIRSTNEVTYTTPYKDVRTGDTIVSAVRNIDVNGSIKGILVVDININWLVEYVGSLTLAKGGYGILLSQNMSLMTYPDSAFINHQLQDLGSSYEEIAQILRNGENIFARKVLDRDNSHIITFFTRISNGWYVGIATPYLSFYEDLYVSATILILLGFTLSILLCFMLLRLSAEKMRADEESKSKSSFLASMSHEIRTPMNAITGMTELLLRSNLTDEARLYAHDIKQASANLISIINDILDFSKIEAGKMKISHTKYFLSSLVNDTVNIIRTRLIGKPIRFFTNIDGNIPNSLIGDEVRLRQILLNLLSNSVKFSEKGNIGLSIVIDKQEDEKIWLKITVTDTGYGIKPDDKIKLFENFMQLDSKKNSNIEGTGLGLPITKHLCVAMGGHISVESEYGKGSAFTVVIPQEIDSKAPFAAVESPEKKKVLVYEGRSVYSNSVCWSLANMRVPYTLVTTADDLAEALRREEWFFIFSGYGLYSRIKPVMDAGDFFNGKKPPLALMGERGVDAYIPNVSFISQPVQALSIANILNDLTNSNGYTESSVLSSVIPFTAKNARLLVVDDIDTNLKVVEGLLAPYEAEIDTSLSGKQAVELVKQKEYDIVFMDHMMPEMDGIETTTAIRSLEGKRFKTMPIVALTANAVVGMREMFLEKGFSDFLSKPIEVTKFDELLDRWIPKEKKDFGKG